MKAEFIYRILKMNSGFLKSKLLSVNCGQNVRASVSRN